MTKFSIEAVSAHIRRKHPACPDFAVAWFAAEIASKSWRRASLGKAVGITMQTYLRHNHTDYDFLLLTGVERNEARRRVQPRIDALIRSWSKVKPPRSLSAHDDRSEEEGHNHGS